MMLGGLLGRISSARSATSVEVTLIAAVMFCLPLFEAPKNVIGVCFLIFWGWGAFCNKTVGLRSPFDLPITALAALLWIAPAFSDFGDVVTPMDSAPRWTLLALFVLAASRLDYSRTQATAILAALMLGSVLAVAESFWAWSLNCKEYPEFRSVGHVNHSSMYSLIPLASGIGFLSMRERWMQILGMVAIMATLAFLIPSKSLVGALAISVIVVVGVSAWAVRGLLLRDIVVASCALVISVMGGLAASTISSSRAEVMLRVSGDQCPIVGEVGGQPAVEFRTELVSRITGDDFFSHRDKILNSALAVWDRHPLIGTGWYSFGIATSEEEVRAALSEDGIDYDPTVYAHFPHGHNLWTTMLIERGLLGVGLVTLLLMLYFWTFIPLILNRNRVGAVDVGMAVAALLVAVGFSVAGIGNTTMMNEHGQAGMGLIAVCYGYLRGRGLLGVTS